MGKLKAVFLIVLLLSGMAAEASRKQFVGVWEHISGDPIWARLEIDKHMNVRAYRFCGAIACDLPMRFRVKTYGRSRFSLNHTLAKGWIYDTGEQFVANEYFEIQGNKLVLREYQRYLEPNGRADQTHRMKFELSH
ncbi:MAG: hypothetical protein J7501_08745 [Bdellovibrio sp.]|nr:hypothetical protein [Bdellovibrio sp.]